MWDFCLIIQLQSVVKKNKDLKMGFIWDVTLTTSNIKTLFAVKQVDTQLGKKKSFYRYKH